MNFKLTHAQLEKATDGDLSTIKMIVENRNAFRNLFREIVQSVANDKGVFVPQSMMEKAMDDVFDSMKDYLEVKTHEN